MAQVGNPSPDKWTLGVLEAIVVVETVTFVGVAVVVLRSNQWWLMVFRSQVDDADGHTMVVHMVHLR